MQEPLLNTHCFIEACKRKNVPFRVRDTWGNVVSLSFDGREYFFVNFATPFNNGGINQICKDKEFTYRLLKDSVKMPKTLGFFDPKHEDERFYKYKKKLSYDEVVQKILSEFSLPVIVKMNAGTRGMNVYKCGNEGEVRKSVETIFRKDSRRYDYIALGQTYIPPVHEFRVVTFREKVLLAYEKDISAARFIGNLSPLHYENAKAVHLTDKKTLKVFEKFLMPVFATFPVEFAGFDIVEDKSGLLYLLEINTAPGFYHFAKDNGEEPIVGMYERILEMMTLR